MKNKISIKFILIDIIVSFYLSLALTMTFISDVKKIWIIIPITFTVTGLLYYIFIIQDIGNSIVIKTVQYDSRQRCVTVFICGTLVCVGQIFYWMAYFPGGFNLDSYGHWDQVHGVLELNDWHSIIVTGIYWVLTRVSDTVEFCIGVQILLFSLSYVGLINVLCKNGIPKKCIYIASFVTAFWPSIGMNNICIIKDVYFTICLIWMLICLIGLVNSGKNNKNDKLFIVGLTILSVLMTLIRHNGILAVVPVWIYLFIKYRKNLWKILLSLCIYILIILLVYGPFFKVANISKHNNIVGETTGVAMSLITNAYINEPDKLPDEVTKFVESLSSREELKRLYIVGEWDSCRWEIGGAELLQDESFSFIVSLAIKTAIVCPGSAYESFRENTRIVWQIFGYADWEPWVYIEQPNVYGIEEKPVAVVKEIEEKINSISHTFGGCLMVWNMGVYIAVICVLLLYLQMRKQFERSIFALPLIIYALGTMFLLCGPNQRYFYYFSVLFLPVIFMILREEGKRENEC